jgi:hypothetical protein
MTALYHWLGAEADALAPLKPTAEMRPLRAEWDGRYSVVSGNTIVMQGQMDVPSRTTWWGDVYNGDQSPDVP